MKMNVRKMKTCWTKSEIKEEIKMNNTKKYHISNLHPEIFSADGPSISELEKWIKDLYVPTTDDLYNVLAENDVSRRFGQPTKLYMAIYRELLMHVCDIPYVLCEHACNEILTRLESALESAATLDEPFWKSIAMKFVSGGICDEVRRANGFYRKTIESCGDALNCVIDKFASDVSGCLSDALGPMERVCDRTYYQSDFCYDIAGAIAEKFVNAMYACVRIRCVDYITNSRITATFPIGKLLFCPSTMHILCRQEGYRRHHNTSLIVTESDVDTIVEAIVYINSHMHLAVNARMLIAAVDIGKAVAELEREFKQSF